MTDIYVRRPASGRNPWFFISIGGGLAVLALAVWMFTGTGSPPPSDDLSSDSRSEETEPASQIEREQPRTPSEPETEPPPGSDPGASLLARAKNLRDGGNLEAARETAYQIMDASRDSHSLESARQMLGEINIELALTPRDMKEKVDYTVQSGDSLARIAKNYKTNVELIQKSNNIKGSLIRVGDRLRILTGDFSIVVDKTDNLLDLYLNNRFFKRYRVGTGKFDKTPEGDFLVNDRIAQPTWWRPDGKAIPYGDPDNLLGTHWLSLNIRGYGIHGTWEPDTIGKELSAGCVRLLNEDIEELFTLIPLNTPVRIQK